MDELVYGFIIVLIIVTMLRLITTYHNYKHTIYPQIYSSFIEFVYRKSSTKKLSTSYWFENNFGFHKILYYTNTTTSKKVPEIFVVLILTSGVYIINSKNLIGILRVDKNKKWRFITTFINTKAKKLSDESIYLPNIIKETELFAKRIKTMTKINNVAMIQFLDGTTFDIQEEDITFPMLCSKDVFDTIQKNHIKNGSQLSEPEIYHLYSILEKELTI